MMASTPTAVSHPLDPLGPGEIEEACKLFGELAGLTSQSRFALVGLDEPSRAEMRGHADGSSVERRVRIVTVDRSGGASLEGIVSLTTGQLLRRREIDPVGEGQPPVLVEEFEEVEALVKADPAWQRAVLARGVENLDLVQVDPVSAGRFDHEDEAGLRIIRAVAYARCEDGDNAYAHPIDGLVAHVDLTNRRILQLDDDEVLAQPRACSNFHDHVDRQPRSDLRPLDVIQPEGPSFSVDGWHVTWQKWDLRLSVNAREGLVLHQVGYQDGDVLRPILHRASIAEMVVPYGDPRPAHFWRSAFDAGEYGLGTLMQSLELGCDCLGEIYYFDVHLADAAGVAQMITNAVCMHEEDYGVLWRHSDIRYGGDWVRRSRRLVLSFFATVGNYDYGFFWYFYQDGTIQFEAKLTGIMQTAVLPAGESSPFLSRVGPELGAQLHQHFFCARLDPAVDGPLNAVIESEIATVPIGDQNPYGNAFATAERVLATEQAAQRVCDPLAARTWKIANLERTTELGTHPAYKLVPAGGPLLHADPNSWIARRAAFALKHLWVTAYDPDQRFPAGDYPNQGLPAGLPHWAETDRALESKELVVWHSFGSTHVPKPEDWPIMPVDHIGFSLRPAGFFTENAALDVPKPGRGAEGHQSCHG